MVKPTAALSAAMTGRTFRTPVGRKQIWLPNFLITLTRTPKLPPTMANFIVPLNLNKLDLKDYLYHAYSIRALAVRSYIKQQPVRQGKAGDKIFHPRRFYRPRAIKHMIVEMEEPFVWPEELEGEELEPWDKSTWDKAEEAQKKMNEDAMAGPGLKRGDMALVGEQARGFLEGKRVWRPSWQEFKGLEGEMPNAVDVRK